VNGPLQASAAEAHGNNYALVMAVVIGVVALVICALIPFSRERRGIDMTQSARHVGAHPQGSTVEGQV
jgi:SHS family lactate transporter-like MFS transporter